ncbi:type II toxin-antitoxin system RatA family toxin [Streptomyces sp. NPDC007264]|uniref:type II toxin-antitoxin system RatA family toxin n=1 Tax=Streptomyces sp. NPDC007264 TaxID=3364777 RepID=UPI0036DD15C0
MIAGTGHRRSVEGRRREFDHVFRLFRISRLFLEETFMHVMHNTCTGAAAPEQVWKMLVDCEAFPDFLDGVNEVTILDEDGDRRISSWVVELRGSEMEWEQEDHLDHEKRRWDFRQTEGDLTHYAGHWQVVEDVEGVALELEVEFDVGLPMLADMIHPVVAKALEGYQRGIIGQSA